jgi:uncharacterized protein
VPVFPLPDFVLFPRAVMPLHVFELRYRALVRDVLRGDRLIAFGLLRPGWERDYHGSPSFYPIGCLARVELVEWRPDDCYDLWIAGLSRVRFMRVTREYPYRAASLALVPQEPLDEDDPLIQLERQALSETYQRIPGAAGLPWASGGPGAQTPADGAGLSFEAYVNAICAALTLDPAEKLALLEIDSVLERSRRVREKIDLALRRPKPREGGDRN